MAFTPTVWTNGAPPGISKAELDKLGSQYAQVFTDITHADLGGVTTDQHHPQSHAVSDHSDIIVASKAADETVNNDTLQNDDDLVFAVGVNENWVVDLYLFYTSTAVADFKFKFSVPAGCELEGIVIDQFHAGSNTDNFNEGDTVACGTAGATTEVYMQIHATVRVAGTAGNVQFQWAQDTTEATDTKLKEGSALVARKVS